jgi:hypothetical protein
MDRSDVGVAAGLYRLMEAHPIHIEVGKAAVLQKGEGHQR